LEPDWETDEAESDGSGSGEGDDEDDADEIDCASRGLPFSASLTPRRTARRVDLLRRLPSLHCTVNSHHASARAKPASTGSSELFSSRGCRAAPACDHPDPGGAVESVLVVTRRSFIHTLYAPPALACKPAFGFPSGLLLGSPVEVAPTAFVASI
jgi:hypothetical protein